MSLRYVLTSGVVENVFLCICAYFQTKETPETFFQKRYFWPSGVVKGVFWCFFAYFQTTRIMSLKKIFFNIWMLLRILPDHQKLFFKKDIFYRLQWLKTCFDAFAHTSRSPETFFQKRYFWPSGVVKNVFWCIFAYFQTTRFMSLKKIFFNIWSG
jgi:hypothetical protein